ncbi:hypothetical protein ES703_109035 [subsurface metagenome]
MSGHDGLYPSLDSLFKRIEFNLIQAASISSYGGKKAVRILIRIPMTRKMFGCCYQAIFLAALYEGNCQTANLFWIFTKRTDIDDRILRVDIHINHRRISHMNPKSSSFKGGYFAHEIGLLLRPGCPYRHKRGK